MTPCARLDGYVDGGLTRAEREAFEDHLIECARCQAALEDGMQIAAAASELARVPGRPHAVLPRRGRWVAIAAVCASAAAAIVIWRVLPETPSIEERVASSLAPHRALQARLPYAPLDRHRPYDTQRGATDAENISLALAAEVEAHRGAGALGAIHIARRDLENAMKLLARSGGDDVALAWSALELVRRDPRRALPHTDIVLAKSPRNTTAAWNRAIALKELELPLAAAEMFQVVAAAGEPGWSEEARGEATRLLAREQARQQRWLEDKAACDALARGTVGAREVIERAVSVCRPGFYEAVRLARTDAQRAALVDVARYVDEGTGATAAQDLLRKVRASRDREHAIDVFLKITQPGVSEADKLQLVGELRASGHDDLLLGAISRGGLTSLRGEYIERALASKNPYLIEIARERQAEELLAHGDPLAAEALLVPLTTACAKSDVELRCSYLMFALATVYETMHRPAKSRELVLLALERSRRLGTYWDERLYFDYLADAARLDHDHAAMRAYLREATLRSGGECEQERFALEALAEASIDSLAFMQARRDLAAAPSCGQPATPNKLRVLAELAHVGGTAEDLEAARAGLAAARQTELSLGERAELDAIEGRLLAAKDAGAATPLLRRAIAATKTALPTDVPALKARADAFASLIVLAATRDDAAGTFALFEEATGVGDAAPCTVGAMVDADRIVVVARTGGELLLHFEPRGRRAAAIDASMLVPKKTSEALAACARVDVLALPPVFGLPELLPAELPWSYRGRTARITTPRDARPTVLAVADTKPPAELGLAPLATTELAPIAGASHVDLRGAAATPSRTLASLPRADAIEIHSHGYMNLGTTDAALIALSPDGDDKFTLNARDIAAQSLPKAPVVVLAACHAGYSAPYRHESWGLPRAFLLAGARVVLASRDAIPDGQAGFFRAVEAQILAGTDPAVALRDARMKALAAKPDSWTRGVLLFD